LPTQRLASSPAGIGSTTSTVAPQNHPCEFIMVSVRRRRQSSPCGGPGVCASGKSVANWEPQRDRRWCEGSFRPIRSVVSRLMSAPVREGEAPAEPPMLMWKLTRRLDAGLTHARAPRRKVHADGPLPLASLREIPMGARPTANRPAPRSHQGRRDTGIPGWYRTGRTPARIPPTLETRTL